VIDLVGGAFLKMSGLGKVQKKVLAGTSQGIVLLHQMKGSQSSLSRAVRSLERKGLVQIWKVRVPAPSGTQHPVSLRKITVVAPPGTNQKHVVGEAFGRMWRSGYPGRQEVKITVVTPPGYNQKHVVRRAFGRLLRNGHRVRQEVKITVVTPRGYNQKHVVRRAVGRIWRNRLIEETCISR